MILKNKIVKITELILNWITLIWLLAISYLLGQQYSFIDNLGIDINHQYGQVYMLE